MRAPTTHVARDGKKTFKVRYRQGDMERSKTFRRKADAEKFAALLGRGGRAELADALAWLERQKGGEKPRETFAAWFEGYIEQLTGVSDRTRNDYRSMHRRYLAALDDLPLDAISRAHVTTIVNDMDRAGRSPKTIRQATHLLSTSLKLAINEGLLVRNPCVGVRLPKQQLGGAKPRFLTYEQAGQLIVEIPAHYRPLVMCLFFTGLRWSEATALMGRHVNLEKGTIYVEQAWKRVPGKPFVIGPPKTEKSTRTVNAGVGALVGLTNLVETVGPNDLLFLTKSGGPVRHANFFTNIWQPAVRRLGWEPPPRIHDTRHSHASWLISDGKSLESVQDQLGHESILTTRAVYGWLQPALGAELGLSASAAAARVLAARPVPLALERRGGEE